MKTAKLKKIMEEVYLDWEKKQGPVEARERLFSLVLCHLQPDHEEVYEDLAKSFEKSYESIKNKKSA